jgi:hypothetical protein
MTNLIAAVRSALTSSSLSLYVLIAGPFALAIGIGLKNKKRFGPRAYRCRPGP